MPFLAMEQVIKFSPSCRREDAPRSSAHLAYGHVAEPRHDASCLQSKNMLLHVYVRIADPEVFNLFWQQRVGGGQDGAGWLGARIFFEG